MDDKSRPLFRNLFLILAGGFAIMGFTLNGVLFPGDVLRDDPQFGPVIAASRVVIPLFATLAVVVLLAKFKVCKHCGKIFFWKNPDN